MAIFGCAEACPA